MKLMNVTIYIYGVHCCYDTQNGIDAIAMKYKHYSLRVLQKIIKKNINLDIMHNNIKRLHELKYLMKIIDKRPLSKICSILKYASFAMQF
jgi:hypothetical protein